MHQAPFSRSMTHVRSSDITVKCEIEMCKESNKTLGQSFLLTLYMKRIPCINDLIEIGPYEILLGVEKRLVTSISFFYPASKGGGIYTVLALFVLPSFSP